MATIIICILLALCVVLAVRRVRKKGTCDCGCCNEADYCPGNANNQKKL